MQKIFISYSHLDCEWLERLCIFLKPLERRYEVDIWNDNRIEPGTPWKEEIDEAIKTADIAILLVSQNFLGSEFILKDELPPLLEAAEKKGTKIVSLLIRPCQYMTSILSKYQAVNTPDNPLNILTEGEQDTVLLELTNLIESWLNNPGASITVPVKGCIDSRALVFDIDGTLLFKDEDLESNDKRSLFSQLGDLVRAGFHIVFITGNDYLEQKPRVLMPLVKHGLAESVICFSDGGSRVFDYNSMDFVENTEYSKSHILKSSEVTKIENIYRELLEEFVSDHEELKTPDISLKEKRKRRLEFSVYPIRPRFFKESFSSLKSDIEAKLTSANIESDWEIIDSIAPNTITFRLSGSNVFEEAFVVQNRLQDLFHSEYKDISIPELIRRGEDDEHICQLALKPFKLNELRTLFLHKLREKLEDLPEGRNLTCLLGGSTTIDIQRNSVNKVSAILYLIEHYGYKNKNLISQESRVLRSIFHAQ